MKNQSYLKIKELPLEDRPREKLKKFGSTSLTNRELIAIFLRTGNAHHGSVLDLSAKILEKAGNSLHNLIRFSIKDFLSIPGIGETKAITLLAVLEFAKRLAQEKITNQSPSFTGPETVFEYLHLEMAALEVEEFRVLLLNNANQLISSYTVSTGLVNETLVHPREIFKHAIRENASSVILVHNHPSNQSKPSSQDIEVTKQIVEAGKLLNIPVLDHIIVTSKEYFSFKEEDLL